MEESKKAQATWKTFLLVCFYIFLGIFLVAWPFTGFIAALQWAGAFTALDILFVVFLAFYWWTRGVGIDLGFVKIRGMGWPKEGP